MPDRFDHEVGAQGAQVAPQRRRWPLRLLSACLVVLTGGIIYGASVVRSLDDFDTVTSRASTDIFLQDRFGQPLLGPGGVIRHYAPLADIPAELQNAVIAIEDRRYREHRGLDLRAIARAFVSNAAAGEIVEGGSTITQQLIKTRFLTSERSYARKLHEAMLAQAMESRLSKDEILERYLNHIYLGNSITGVAAAAHRYFGKKLADLTLAESAALAATIRAPSLVNPFDNISALRQRASLVVRLMQQQGRINAGRADAALAEIAAMVSQRRRSAYGGWFADWASGHATDRIEANGTRIVVRTTLNPELQALAEQAVAEALDGKPVEAAMVVLRPDGTVAAMVGGRNYEASQFNRATQALRQPGSTFKLFVYLAALGTGLTPRSLVADQPVDIGGYAPRNFGGGYHGYVSLAYAFAHSLNVSAVQLANYIGIEKVADAARALGIEADLTETPSLALGASEVTLLDLTEAYAAVATGIAPVIARGIEAAVAGNGRALPVGIASPKKPNEADALLAHRGEMVSMLRAAVTSGTGAAAAGIDNAVGKTGTSQEYRDALFVGWNDSLITGVWLGNDDSTPMDQVTGGDAPAAIWAAFMKAAPDVLARTEGAAIPGPLLVEGSPAPALAAAREATPTPQARHQPEPRRRQGFLADLATALGIRGQGRVGSCNIRACASAYRSFRASDCSFQPYGEGPRQLCRR